MEDVLIKPLLKGLAIGLIICLPFAYAIHVLNKKEKAYYEQIKHENHGKPRQ